MFHNVDDGYLITHTPAIVKIISFFTKSQRLVQQLLQRIIFIVVVLPFMEYQYTRKDILEYLILLQKKGFSYQTICDYINSQQTDFVLFKDFFSRFQSKLTYYKSSAKQEKLSLIHHHLQILYQQNVEDVDGIHDLLCQLIADASTEKFEAYLNVYRTHNFLPSKTSEFYLEGNPAYHSIKNDILHKNQYEWELDILNHGSTFKILSIEVTSLFQQSGVVSTEEFWKLFWVNKYSKKLQFKYESLGHHTYLVAKNEEGNWKVIENMTKTPTNTRMPEYVDYPILRHDATNNWETNRITINDLFANNNILHAIEFIKIVHQKILDNKQLTILNRFKESYLNTHRLLNTNVVNFSVYQEEMKLLKTQVQLFCDVVFLAQKTK